MSSQCGVAVLDMFSGILPSWNGFCGNQSNDNSTNDSLATMTGQTRCYSLLCWALLCLIFAVLNHDWEFSYYNPSTDSTTSENECFNKSCVIFPCSALYDNPTACNWCVISYVFLQLKNQLLVKMLPGLFDNWEKILTVQEFWAQPRIHYLKDVRSLKMNSIDKFLKL